MPYSHVPVIFSSLIITFKFSDCSVFKIQTVVRVHTIVAEVSASFKRTPPGYGYD